MIFCNSSEKINEWNAIFIFAAAAQNFDDLEIKNAISGKLNEPKTASKKFQLKTEATKIS